MCICMRACMHLHMVHRCATVNSLTPRCGGDPIRAQEWSRCGLLCVRFLFGIERQANRWKLLRCESPAMEPEMAGAFACARKHLLCTCMCVRICVSISVYVWMYVSWHVYVHANMRATRVALSVVCH